MQVDPPLEKHFNRFVLRGFGACLLATLGIIGVAFVFWQVRDIVPFTLAIVLFCLGAVAWLFGARAMMDEVIPNIEEIFDQSSEEELRRVMATHPPSTDIHVLARKALAKRMNAPTA